MAVEVGGVGEESLSKEAVYMGGHTFFTLVRPVREASLTAVEVVDAAVEGNHLAQKLSLLLPK